VVILMLEDKVRLPFAAGNCCRIDAGTVNVPLSPVVTQRKTPESIIGLAGVLPGAARLDDPLMVTVSVPPPVHLIVKSWLRGMGLGTRAGDQQRLGHHDGGLKWADILAAGASDGVVPSRQDRTVDDGDPVHLAV
jgi:hypothetical protein